MTQTQILTPQTIDAPSLKQWLDHKSVLLIDVRETVEYANSHIPGAICHPLSSFEPSQINLHPDQRLVLYCRSGKRSALAAEQLNAEGFTDITELQCGIAAWETEGYPVEQSPSAPISLLRQVQITAGTLIVLGTLLGALGAEWGLLLSGVIGMGLIFAGITDSCVMGMLLAKLPYNQRVGQLQ